MIIKFKSDNMNKTYIFGHKSPDTDTITSSLVMCEFERQLGNENAVACRLGNINKETEFVLNYLDIEAPELIESLDEGSDVILVDHNSPSESIDNLENMNIKKVIDHHKIALETSYPLFYRAEPVGCSETILYKLYNENNVEIKTEENTNTLQEQQNNIQSIATVDQSNENFLNNTQNNSTTKSEKMNEKSSYIFIFVIFAIILLAIVFLFPLLNKFF